MVIILNVLQQVDMNRTRGEQEHGRRSTFLTIFIGCRVPELRSAEVLASVHVHLYMSSLRNRKCSDLIYDLSVALGGFFFRLYLDISYSRHSFVSHWLLS